MAGRLRKVMLPMSLALVKLRLGYSQFWTCQCRRDFDKLQDGATEVVRGPEHTTCKQKLRELTSFRLKKRCQMEDISDVYTTFCVAVEKVEPDFSLRCTVMGQAANTSCS